MAHFLAALGFTRLIKLDEQQDRWAAPVMSENEREPNGFKLSYLFEQGLKAQDDTIADQACQPLRRRRLKVRGEERFFPPLTSMAVVP